MSTPLGPRARNGTSTVTMLALAVALVALGGTVAHAQRGVIMGRITDARSTQPVVSATVEIQGTRLVGTAGDDGRFRIANVPAGSYTLTARRIGYAVGRRTVTVADGEQVTADVALQPSVISLDQVVITGTAGGEELRSIGNAVSTINASEVLDKSAAPDLGSLLSARTPGVVVSTGTGRVGAGQAIMIRGRSSIGLGNSPLIYIDGVRVNNAVATGPSGVPGGTSFGAQGASVGGRLNDISPEDIERIEVIKGPAASTIYGTEASNGVIQIITKKGSGAKPQFALQVQGGTLWFRNDEGRIPTNYFACRAADVAQTALSPLCRGQAVGTVVPWNAIQQEKDRGDPLFRTGQTSLINGSVSGGRDDLRYFVSAAYDKQKGIEPNNHVQQVSTHANLDIAITPKIDLAASLNYVDLRSHLGTDFGASAMLGAVFGHGVLFAPFRGFGLGFPPEVTQDLWDNFQNVNRLTASGTLSHVPTSWFRHRLVMGVDYTGDDSRALERFAPPNLAAILPAVTAAGRINQILRSVNGITGDYSGTASFTLMPTLSTATSLGLQLFRTESNTSTLGGLGFPGPGTETVSATAQPATPTQTVNVNTTVGGYVQQKFNWRERFFLTGAVRVDNNSAFGEDFKWITYPKVDASWVVSEEGFWPKVNAINALRLRAAYGESGRQPQTFSALQTFTPVQGPGGTNAVTPNQVGNPDLRPERGKEIEVGFEAGLFDRVSLDFTYFNKRTVDEIIDQPIAPSSGFAGTRPLNLGRVDNRGIELSASAQVLRRRPVQWELAGNVATNRDEIKDMGGLPSVIVNYGQYNRVGYPIGAIFTRRVVSADRDVTTGRATNILCENPGQAPVACAQAPFVFIGTPTPKVSGSVSNTFTFLDRLRLYALVDFKRGNKVANNNELLRCTGGVGAPLCRANYYPQEFDPIYLAAVTGTAFTQGYVDQYYQSGSFAKLREVSLAYTIPQRFTYGAAGASVSLAARELHTWTKYRGPDPEVNANSPASATTSDQARIPPLTRLILTLNVRF